MEKITLFHGTSNRIVVPTYGLGEKKHDYGMGFYLTDNLNLAKEWAVCKPDDENGWVHQYELDTDQLKILDFQEKDVLSWLAELMKHRDASDSKRYRVLSKKFIEKYGIDTELLSLGGLGIQYCIKSRLAYEHLQEVQDGLLSVDYMEFREKYNQRDVSARQKMRELIDSDANKVTNVFSTLL